MRAEQIGKYQIVQHLASGGMASVYLARVTGQVAKAGDLGQLAGGLFQLLGEVSANLRRVLDEA